MNKTNSITPELIKKWMADEDTDGFCTVGAMPTDEEMQAATKEAEAQLAAAIAQREAAEADAPRIKAISTAIAKIISIVRDMDPGKWERWLNMMDRMHFTNWAEHFRQLREALDELDALTAHGDGQEGKG